LATLKTPDVNKQNPFKTNKQTNTDHDNGDFNLCFFFGCCCKFYSF